MWLILLKNKTHYNTKPPTTSGNSLTQKLNHYGRKTRVKFTGSCFTHIAQ